MGRTQSHDLKLEIYNRGKTEDTGEYVTLYMIPSGNKFKDLLLRPTKSLH